MIYFLLNKHHIRYDFDQYHILHDFTFNLIISFAGFMPRRSGICLIRKLIVRPELRRIVDGFLAVPDGSQPVQGADYRGNDRGVINATGTE